MKTEDLEEKGLTQEQIDFVMAENGKDIQAEQNKITAKQAEVDKLSAQLSEANKQVQAFKEMKVEDIKAKAEEFEAKYLKSQEELKEARENAMMDKVLGTLNAHDVDVIKGLIKKDQLVFKEDTIVGLDEQIKALRESKAFLFKDDDGDEKKPTFTSKTGGAPSRITKEEFSKMGYFDRVKLKNDDEALYNELTKGE